MAEGARRWAYPSFGGDEGLIVHTQDIRSTRTHVNVDCVNAPCDKPYVSNDDSTGAQLRAIWQRSGLSMAKFAKAAGYSGASSVQRYLDDAYEGALALDLATKFADALEGLGEPMIRRAEIMALTGFEPSGNASTFRMEGASLDRMSRDVPIWGASIGATSIPEGDCVELTALNTGDIIGYEKRPVILNGRGDVYGLYVQGSSMSPRHEEGDTLYVDPKRTPKVGDDVIVYLRVNGESDDGERSSMVLVKRLVRTTAAYIELEQFTPAITFRLDRQRVLRVERVIPWRELIS